LSGTIPSSLTNLTNINAPGDYLDLGQNYFTFDGMELIEKIIFTKCSFRLLASKKYSPSSKW